MSPRKGAVKPTRRSNPETAIVADVMKALRVLGLFVWRQNTLPIPLRQGNKITGFRPALKRGVSDILGIVPVPVYLLIDGEYINVSAGVMLAVEVKQPKAKLSDIQVEFRDEVLRNGGVYLEVHSAAEALELIGPYLNGQMTPTAAR
jgi:hypothetical protein